MSENRPRATVYVNHQLEAVQEVRVNADNVNVIHPPPVDTSQFRKELDAALDHYFRWHLLTLASWLLLVISLTSNCNGRG